ncbi:DUF3833 domain-containing protein [Halobacteriovorax sp.]|uniref:DUF3833 domain-containing protein n=1 Tax=Halobacteriovorax sp. TaxID=2020862 RepID=UPI003564E74C
MNKVVLLVLFLFQVSCADHSVMNYKDEEPKLNLRSFFNGNIYALGIVQDRSGVIIQRFKVDMVANWKGNVATLDEKFLYSDGTKGERIWTLTEKEGRMYEGTAGDVDGKARGQVSGNTFFFEYVLNVPVGESVYRVKLEDWMFLLDDNTLMARSYMSKWGFDVGEVTIVMMKRK